MRNLLCSLHKHGVTPDHPPFFQENCPRCEDKKRRGIVTGLEPPPRAFRNLHLRRTINGHYKEACAARRKAYA